MYKLGVVLLWITSNVLGLYAVSKILFEKFQPITRVMQLYVVIVLAILFAICIHYAASRAARFFLTGTDWEQKQEK